MASTHLTLPQATTVQQPVLRPLRVPLLPGLGTARLALIMMLAVLVLTVASLVYLNLAASVNVYSNRLQDLTQERRGLEWQRAEKMRQLAQVTHPDRLEARATELGFRPPRSIAYLAVSPDVAAALEPDGRPAADARVARAAQPTGWTAIRSQFDRWLGRAEASR